MDIRPEFNVHQEIHGRIETFNLCLCPRTDAFQSSVETYLLVRIVRLILTEQNELQ